MPTDADQRLQRARERFAKEHGYDPFVMGETAICFAADFAQAEVASLEKEVAHLRRECERLDADCDNWMIRAAAAEAEVDRRDDEMHCAPCNHRKQPIGGPGCICVVTYKQQLPQAVARAYEDAASIVENFDYTKLVPRCEIKDLLAAAIRAGGKEPK